MKTNRTVWIIVALSLAVVLIVSLTFGGNEEPAEQEKSAVPNNAAVIFELKSAEFLLKSKKKSKTAADLLNTFFPDELLFNIDTIARLEETSSFIEEISDKKVYISLHNLSKQQTEYLYTLPIDKKKQKQMHKALLHTLNKYGSTKERLYDNAQLIKYTPDNKELSNYTFSLHKGFFIASKSIVLAEKSIRELNSDYKAEIDNMTKKLYSALSSNTDIRISINYEYLHETVATFTNKNIAEYLSYIKSFARITILEYKFETETYRLTGYTLPKQSQKYIKVFQNIEPAPLDILKLFPENTAGYYVSAIGSGDNYEQAFVRYLTELKVEKELKAKINRFIKNNKLHKQKSIYRYFESEAAVFYTDIRNNGSKHHKYGIITIAEYEKLKELSDSLTARKIKADNNYPRKNRFNYNTSGKEFTVRRLPSKFFPVQLFPNVFKDLDAKYYCFLQEEYMLLAENREAMEAYLSDFASKKLFDRNTKAQNLNKNLPDNAHIALWTDIYGMNEIIAGALSKNEKEKFKNQLPRWRKINGPAFRILADEIPAYTGIAFRFDPGPARKTETAWELRTDTSSRNKPYTGINHNTGEREIILQDASDKLYLIDKNGKIIWTRIIEGQIISDIEQMDYYKNNKLQYLFNTKKQIHLIDREGNYVEGYPVNLSSPASGPLALFDYDHDKKYRICLPLQDKSVIMCDKTGNPLSGWVFGKALKPISKKAKHFVSNGKDYIVFTDNSKIYITNRRGEIRVKPQAEIPLAENAEIYFEQKSEFNPKARFITTSPSGTPFFIYTDGKMAKYSMPQKFSSKHFFIYQDLNGDKKYEYIFVDNTTITAFDYKKNTLFNKNFDKNISKPSIYRFSDTDIKLGFNIPETNKLYLIDKEGKTENGFPLQGSGEFSITIFTQGSPFSLITNKPNGLLGKYKLDIK